MKTDCIEKPLTGLFYKLGKQIARCPWPFIIIPILISGGCGVGLIRLRNVSDVEYLYTPDNGPAKEERAIMRRHFPMDWSENFQASRSHTLDGYARVIFIPKNNKANALSENILSEIIEVDEKIRKITTKDNKTYNFYCARSNGCYSNGILEILNYTASSINHINLTFPMFEHRFLGTELGGVTFKEGKGEVVDSVKAIRLQYYVKYENSSNMEVSDVWLESFKNLNLSIKTNDVNTYFLTSKSLTEELESATTGTISSFSIAYTILCTFSIVACLMFDWVRCKPWLGFIGVITACFAILTSLGLLCAVGVEFTSIVATMPFLIIGIGLDDMFIQVSAWRETSYHDTVEERMGLTFKDAAMSITLTSLTNTLAFCIGAITSFPSVRIFCLYTGVAVVFCFIYQITFFGGCMALLGRREHANRHCYACIKVLPKEEASDKSSMYRVWCSGGSRTHSKGTTIHAGTEFFKSYFGPVLMHLVSKIIVILTFLGYMGVAIWGVLNLREGLELKNLAPDDSYATSYYHHDDKLFNGVYGPRIQVAVKQPLEYWNASSLKELDKLIDDLKQSKWLFNNETMIENWHRDFSDYLNITRQTNLNSTEYIRILKEQFLKIPGFERYKLDIEFNENENNILASRFLIQSRGTSNADEQRKLMEEVRDIAKSSKLKVTVYHPAFIFFDQYSVVLYNTLQNIGVAVAVMFLVAILLVPHPLSAIWVTLSICSISTGVVGFMTHWGVNLDSISMINIILCIGFSVDYSAHIAYHFVISKAKSKNLKAVASLHSLGLPIAQGAVSTVLGVVVLSTANTYIFRTFFKTMFLVITFGFYHGLFVLPVFLSIVGPGPSNCNKTVEGKVYDKPMEDKVHDELNYDKPIESKVHELNCNTPIEPKMHDKFNYDRSVESKADHELNSYDSLKPKRHEEFKIPRPTILNQPKGQDNLSYISNERPPIDNIHQPNFRGGNFDPHRARRPRSPPCSPPPYQ